MSVHPIEGHACHMCCSPVEKEATGDLKLGQQQQHHYKTHNLGGRRVAGFVKK